MEPEKKDVWEKELDDIWSDHWEFYTTNDQKRNKDIIKSFIKTHFISKAELREKINKLPQWKSKEFPDPTVYLSDLLDLLTQEK